MPPIWKEQRSLKLNSLASHHSGKHGCCLVYEFVYGLQGNSTALRMSQVPGWGTRVPRCVGNMSRLKRSCSRDQRFYRGQGLSTLAARTLGAGSFSGVGAVVCIVGCLAAFEGYTHGASVVSSTPGMWQSSHGSKYFQCPPTPLVENHHERS